MAEIRVQRRLATILVADLVGYGRLTEEDESRAFATLGARCRAGHPADVDSKLREEAR